MFDKLSTERLINLAIDYVKHSQKLPNDLRVKLSELGLLEVLDPDGVTNEDIDDDT